MLLAKEVNKLVSLDSYELTNILSSAGYITEVNSLTSTEFLGINNGGQFCYKITYVDDCCDGEQTGKVFVWKNATGNIVADF